MKKSLFLAAAAILAMQAVPAFAEEGAADGAKRHHKDRGAMMEKMFDQQDANKDGAVSEAEFQASSKKRFESMDGNKDGKVTKEEIKAHHEAKKAERKAKHEEMKAKKESAPE